MATVSWRKRIPISNDPARSHGPSATTVPGLGVGSRPATILGYWYRNIGTLSER
jgi:hypothetical protein